MVENFDVFGVKIAVINLQKTCQVIEDWIAARIKTYVCIAPVATIVSSQKNKKYRQIVNASGMNAPDGMPLVWLGKMKGHKGIERTYGPDLILKFCELNHKKGYKHYFYGATLETNQLLMSKLHKRFPDLNIVGYYSPPFRGACEKEDVSVLEQINKVNPDILWVGLGSPKQDYWMYDHRHSLDVPVMVGVGAAFDFLAGVKKQAPVWMQRCGLEWFFRLCSEPKRLWKRYLVGNAKFIYWVLRDLFRTVK